MRKMNGTFLGSPDGGAPPRTLPQADAPEHPVSITDQRVAQLLIILQDIDAQVKDLESLSDRQLSEIVVEAARACGFTNPGEARNAIASILQVIEFSQFDACGDS